MFHLLLFGGKLIGCLNILNFFFHILQLPIAGLLKQILEYESNKPYQTLAGFACIVNRMFQIQWK